MVDGFSVFVSYDLREIRDVWQTFEADAVLTPFQSFAWLSQVAADPVIVLVYEGECLRMIVPLATDRIMGQRRLAWLGSSLNDYNAPVAGREWLAALDAERARTIWQGMMSLISNIDYAVLTKLPGYIDGVANPFAEIDARPFSCNAYRLMLDGDWGAFYAGLRGAKSRRRLRDKAKRMKKAGRLRIRQIRNPEQKREIIRTSIAWKTSQLRATGARNNFADGRIERHLAAIVGNEKDGRFLRVYVLEVGDILVAANVVLVAGHTMNLFVPAYNHQLFANCSPGTVLLTKLMELATRAGLTCFDFSAGDEPYKLEWSAQPMDMTYNVQSRTMAGWLAVRLACARIDIKRIIKSSARMMRFLQAANHALTQITSGPPLADPVDERSPRANRAASSQSRYSI